jgi:hypothetical protein
VDDEHRHRAKGDAHIDQAVIFRVHEGSSIPPAMLIRTMLGCEVGVVDSRLALAAIFG